MMILTDNRLPPKQSFIIDKEQHLETKDNCKICFDVASQPQQCQGCSNIFCSKCISGWRKFSNRCPMKCSATWYLKPIECLNIRLRCPYSETCEEQIPIEQFQTHMVKCAWLGESAKERLHLKQNNLCSKHHELTYFFQKFIDPQQLLCADCHQVAECRLVCKQCKDYYCKQCRTTRLTKYICPKEHIYSKREPMPNWVCSRCHSLPFYRQKQCYSDTFCRLILCQDCHDELPVPERCLVGWIQDEEYYANKIKYEEGVQSKSKECINPQKE